MKNEPFVIERVYKAPIGRVWEAITDKDQMKNWYFDMAEFRPEVGFEFQFTGESEDRSYLHLCKVTEVVPGQKLTHSWRYDGHEGNSFVMWELFAEGPDQTRLRLTHAGLETFPQHIADFAKENFVAGWTEITGELLRKFVERTVIQKSIAIAAPADKVWEVLLQPETGRQWASQFAEGAYFETDWAEGSEVLWKDKDNQVGTKGIVTEYRPAAYLKVAFYDQITDTAPTPPGEYYETYSLSGQHGSSTLTIESGPFSLQDGERFQPLWDRALAKVKALAEK